MNNKNFKLQELKRWLKTSLKNKISINEKTVIAYLMLGFAGFGTIAEAGWVKAQSKDGGRIIWDDEWQKPGANSVVLGDDNNGKVRNNSEIVVIGFGSDEKTMVDEGGRKSVAIGIGAKVLKDPYGFRSEDSANYKTAGQGVAVGSNAVTTDQAVALGNDSYAVGRSSIAIGNDDNLKYNKYNITSYDYLNYFKNLYKGIDPTGKTYGYNSSGTLTGLNEYVDENDIEGQPTSVSGPGRVLVQLRYSPTLAQGHGSIAIGSRSLAFKDGATALGTLAFALDKGATALGTLSRAEGEGAIAIGNLTRNFAKQALAVGNDSQILKIGGTAVGLRARSGGEGAIAIGTDVYANVKMKTEADSDMKRIHDALKNESTIDLTRLDTIEANITKIKGSVDGSDTIVSNTAKDENNMPYKTDKEGRILTTRRVGNEFKYYRDNTLINPADLRDAPLAYTALVPDTKEEHGIKRIVQNDGANAIVIGTLSAATGDNSLALGRGAFAMGNNSFGLGSYSYANQVNSMAIGTASRSLAKNAIAIGAGTLAGKEANNSSILGTSSTIKKENASIVGAKSTIEQKNSVIFGNSSHILGSANADISTKNTSKIDEILLEQLNAEEDNKNADPNNKKVIDGNNIVVGNNIVIGAGVRNSMAYGFGASIGTSASANNNIKNATAFGMNSKVEKVWNGKDVNEFPAADSSNNYDPALVKFAEKEENKDFMHTGNNAMAIGNASTATLENSVALGFESKTDYTYSDLLKPGWTARGSVAIPTSGQTGVISVGYQGHERRLVNVASGFRDTDAVNVIQLRTLQERIDQQVENIESGMHYLSVNKLGQDSSNGELGSANVTAYINRTKNYDEYITYRIQQLQIQAREKWQNEKFDPTAKKAIDDKVAELARDNRIKIVAKELVEKSVGELAGRKPSEAYTTFVTELENLRKKLTNKKRAEGKENSTDSDDWTPYEKLLSGVNIENLKRETNYSNEGGIGKDSLAIGFRAKAEQNAQNAIAVGYKATAKNVNSIAIGSINKSGGRADDTETIADGSNAISIGSGANSKNWSVAVGGNAKALGDTSVAMGDRALSLGSNSTALGSGSQTGYAVTDKDKTNITYSGASNSVAVGNAAKVYSNFSIAIGNGAEVGELTKTNKNYTDGTPGTYFESTRTKDAPASVVLGSASKSYAEGGTVAGADSQVTGTQSSILGRQSVASANNTTVLGANSTAALANSVALGQGVTVSKSEGAGYLTNQEFTDSGKVVSVGQRRINQLADGKANDDAVTVAQLKKASPILEAQNSGNGATNNKIETNPRATIKIQGDGWGSGDSRYEGKNLATHIKGSVDSPIISIGLKDNPTFNTLKLNNGANNAQDLTLSADNAGNLSVGSKKITGVANGTGNTDAVNYSQLTGSVLKIIAENSDRIQDNTVTTNLGGNVKFQTGVFNAGGVRYQGTNLATFIGKADGTNDPIVTIGMNPNPTFNTLKLNNGASGSQTLTLTPDASGNLGIGNKKITGVADGAANNDAVNYSQLNSVKTTADTAKTKAEEAQTTANEAKSKADDVANKLTTLEDKKIGFNGNSGDKVEKKLGEDIAIKGDDSSITTTAGNNAITIKVKDGGIGTTQLADNAVTTNKIKDATVTEAKLDENLKGKINKANTVAGNNIRLTGDKETATSAAVSKTDDVALNKTGGIEFAINGKSGEIVTKASGTKVEIGLDSTLKTKLAKLDNLDANANDKYATKEELANKASTLNIKSGETTETLNLKDDTLKVTGFGDVTVSLNNKEFTIELSEEAKKKLDNVSAKSDGKDKKDSSKAENADSSGNKGLTKEDKLNGKDLTDKVNALRNGEAGTVVFTDPAGNRLVKANDGKYYKPEFVSPDGTTKANEKGEPAVAVDNPELRVVNNDGTTTNPISLNNIASALGLDGKKPGSATEDYGKPITAEDAKKVMETLLGKNTDLNKAVTLRDLQALAQAGLDFTGNTGTVHRALGTTLNVVGQGTPAADFAGANGNINVVASEVEDQTTKAKITKLEIQLAEALKDIKSIQNGDTKITLGKDGVSVSGQDGKATVGINGGNGTDGASVSVNGKDGKDGVTIKGTDGTNGSSIVVHGKDGKDGKDGVTIKGGDGTNGATITFDKKADGTGTGSITGLKDPELENGKPKDPTAATTVNYVTNQIEGAKTDITNNIKNIVDGGMTYNGNSGDAVKVKLNEAVNIKGEGTYTGTDSATGNIAVVGDNKNSTLEIKLNKALQNIESIQNGDTKVTLGKDGVSVSGKDGKANVAINGGNGTNGASVSVNGKDGKDGVTIKGTDGTNGSSIVVNGKDGKPGVTINGGNGTDGKDGSISFAKDGENGTGSITGLKDPEFNKDGTPKDKTAAATVNYVTNEIKNVTNNINNAIATMDKGLNFVGNDNEKVNAKLDGTVSIKGEGTVPTGTNTAANNIKVEKDTTDKSTGLVVKLADKLTGMTGFETKEEEGKKVTINKDGITFNKDDKGTGTGSITGLKDPDKTDKTAAATVNYVNTEINKSRTIVYKADNQTNGSVSLDKGMEFKGDSNITTKADKDGVVEFKLSKNLDLSTKVGPNYTLGTIKGIKTDEKDPTSVATVDYVEAKMGDTAKIATKALVGVANAVAMANLPQVNNVGNNRHVVSAAYGHYEGQNALALGISGINKERTVVYKGSAALNTNGKIALGVGVGYQFGTDKHDEIQNDSSVKALKEEVAVLKNKDAKNTNIITELKELMKKKDIENEYKSYRLEEENKEIKSYIDELRKENEKTREELKKLMEAVKEKKAETK